MKKILFLAAVLLLAAGCRQQEKFDYGVVEGGKYRNAFFGLTMDVPDAMHVMERVQMDSLAAGMQSSTGAMISGGAQKSAEPARLLLFMSRYPFGADAEDFNYNIVVTCEKLPDALGVKNNEQYMQMAIRMLTAGGADPDMPVSSVELGGRDFMKMRKPLDDAAAQDLYICIRSGYALTIVGTYAGDDQRREVDGIINTITLDT